MVRMKKTCAGKEQRKVMCGYFFKLKVPTKRVVIIVSRQYKKTRQNNAEAF
jgi:hypothetical protein